MIVFLTSECLLNEAKDNFMEQIRSKEHYLVQQPRAPEIWLKNVYGLIFHRKRKRLRVNPELLLHQMAMGYLLIYLEKLGVDSTNHLFSEKVDFLRSCTSQM